MKRLSFLLAALFLTFTAFGQRIQVKGTVTDAASGDPIAFASVVVQGTMTGTASDAEGKYSISVAPNANLVFSSVGYKTQSIAVAGKSVIDCALAPDTEYLDDVLVVAYGTAKKESFTGSAQTIKSEKLEKRTVANVTKALDGLATGVQTTAGSGQPGAGATVVIRGIGSLNASTSPLYVVDGVPYDGAINALNPNDIESMTVIKDASAGALFGARGANGVVIVTTKKGGEGAATVNFKGSWGIASRAVPRYETLDAYQWTEDVLYMYKNQFLDDGYDAASAMQQAIVKINSAANGIFGENEQFNPFTVSVDNLFDPATGKIVAGTGLKWNDDWLTLSTAPAPLRQEYQMTVTGGNRANKYMFSLGYLDENGLVKYTNFKRVSARANVENQVKPWFKTGLNMSFAHNTSNATSLGNSGSSTAYSNVFYTCQLMAPIYPMYLRNADGSYNLDANGEKQYDWGEKRPSGASAGWNPLANLKADKRNTASDNLSGRVFVDLGNLQNGPLAGLKFSVNYGFDLVNAKGLTYYNPEFGDGKTKKGIASVADGRTFSYTFNQLLSYNRAFGDVHLDILAGHEAYSYQYQYLMGEKSGYPLPGLYELETATNIEATTSYTNQYRVESWLSRVNVDIADKYYLSASFRRDGSSRFYKDSRWGNFWSVGGSWRISQESFLSDQAWLNNLTLKASYGVQGNDNLEKLYAWQSLYSLSYPNGSNPGSVITSLESKDLRWEKNKNTNIGIEATVFDRISATVEYYNRYTKDMLMSYPMAMSLGFEGYDKNIGNMKNSGVEISLTGELVKTDKVRYAMTWMGSTIHNKVLNLADKPQILSGNYIIREGETLYSFFLPESAGVDPATGAKLYWVYDQLKDENGDPVDDEFGEPVPDQATRRKSADYQEAQTWRRVCKGRNPILYGSWSHELQIGNVDLSVMTTYSIGGKMNDGVYQSLLYNSYIGQAAHVDRLKAWKQPGDVVTIPKIVPRGASTTVLTDDELFDASYFAIKNITLGYTLPAKAAKAMNVKSARISFTADNLKLFSALKGMDPQYSLTGGTGFSYTPARTLSVGLDINF